MSATRQSSPSAKAPFPAAPGRGVPTATRGRGWRGSLAPVWPDCRLHRRVLWLTGLTLTLAWVAPGAETDQGMPPFALTGDLPRHTGSYTAPQWAWTPVPGLSDVRAIYPHPTRAAVVLVTTGNGVWATADGGTSWHELPALRAEAVGLISDVAFRPAYPDTLVVASATRGLWLSLDGGASVSQIGTAASGLAGDAVATVCFYPADPTRRTLLVGYGSAHAGLSRTSDLGKTWTTLCPGHHLERLLPGRPGARGLFALGAPAGFPDRTDLYYTPSVGQFWRDLLTDILAGDAAVAVNSGDLYLATLDTGLYRVGHGGTRSEPLTPDAERWDSVEVTWGVHADEERLYAYDPRRAGLVVAPLPFHAPQPLGRGLALGAFVRAGAKVRANAGGSRLFATANGTLTVGRNQSAFRIDDVAVAPDTLTVAAYLFSDGLWRRFDADLATFSRTATAGRDAAALLKQLAHFRRAVSADQVQITARVVGPPASGAAAPALTVDLSRLGQSPRSPLFDDGRHGDGQAVDGVYGVALPLDRYALRRRDGDWRCGAPGRVPLTVSAVAADQTLTGAVGVLGLYLIPDTLTLFAEWEGLSLQDPQGEVRLEAVRDRALAATGERCLRLTAGPGPWLAPLGLGYDPWNVAGFYAIGFSIRAGSPSGGTLRLQLQDAPTYTAPTRTPALELSAGATTGGRIAADRYVRVTIPLAQFIDPAGSFLPECLGAMVFSGESDAPATFYLDDLCVYLTPEDAAAATTGGATP